MSALEAKNRKCLFSVLNKDFIVGFRAFANSLCANNPWVRDVGLEILIVDIDLSKEDRKECEKLYPYIQWMEPNEPPQVFNQEETKIGISAFHKLRVFEIEEYDSIISLDCGDMIVKKNIAELFSLDVDIGMVQGWTLDFGWHSPQKAGGTFNGGFVVLNKKHRNKETYQRLVSQKPSPYYDQQIINDEFINRITKLPVEFNFCKRMVECKDLSMDKAKILHFVGEKPWKEYPDKLKYKEIEKHWHEYSKT